MSIREGIEYLKNKKFDFGVQLSPHHRIGSDLVEYMDHVVADLEWAQLAITKCAAADVPWNIKKLFTAIEGAWLHQEKIVQPKEVVRHPKYSFKDVPVVLWSRQSMYRRPRVPGSSSSAPNTANNPSHNRHTRTC